MLERVANAESENSHQEKADQDVEENPDFDNQRHAKGGDQSRQKNAVLEHQQPEYLHERLFAAHHQKRTSKNQRDGGGKSVVWHMHWLAIRMNGRVGKIDDRRDREDGLGGCCRCFYVTHSSQSLGHREKGSWH